MAELVDALVSNTNEAIRAGSIPALGTNGKAGFSETRFICLKTPFPERKPTLDSGNLLIHFGNFANIGVNMNF